MKTVLISGASDDLIEFFGDLGREEFGVHWSEPNDLKFSDGTRVCLRLTDVGWKMIASDGPATVNVIAEADPEEQRTEPEGHAAHSDVVEVTGDFEWVRSEDCLLFEGRCRYRKTFDTPPLIVDGEVWL